MNLIHLVDPQFGAGPVYCPKVFSPEYVMYRKPSSSCGAVSTSAAGSGVEFAYLVLLVYGAHEGSGRRQDLVDEDEDGLFGGQLDPLADNVDELADSEVGGDKVLLLVDGGDVRLFDLLADDLDGVSGKPLKLGDGERVCGVPECGRHTSGECVRLLPCASQRDARP